MTVSLLLERGKTYPMTMYPGYGWGPYQSPITIEALEPRGGSRRELGLAFINHNYPSGVQDMRYDLRILKREADYIVAEVMGTDRTIVIGPAISKHALLP